MLGSVFAVGLDGKLQFRYDFPAGMAPVGSLAEINGTIYGAVRGGGSYGSGFVFAIDPSTNAVRTVVAFPYNMVASGGLIAARGKLYGAAEYATYQNDGGGIFEVGTAGWFTWLYRFSTTYTNVDESDGVNPTVNPVYVNGNFYGTTPLGGNRDGGIFEGLGTVYEINPNGGEKILHRFSAYTSDGIYPNSDFAELNGILYGTTSSGGTGNAGTIFSVVP